jgi:hypothetical protein
MAPALFVVALALTSSSPTAADAALLTGAAAQGASAHAGADVVTSQDLKNALDLEAQRQLVACAEGASCMAEIAAAMDAQFVVSATLGVVEEQLVLQLSVFDVKAARSGGRRMLRATSMTALLADTETATNALLAPHLSTPAPVAPPTATTPQPASDSAAAPGPPTVSLATRTRILVLDVVMPAAASVATAPAAELPATTGASDRFGWWSVGGGAGVVGGLVVGGAGVFVGSTARETALAAFDTSLRPAGSRALTERANALGAVAVGLVIGGGVLALGGAGAIVWDGVIE